MGSSIHIKDLEEDDIELVMPLLLKMHEESNYKHVRLDEDHLDANIFGWIIQDNFFFQGAFDSNKKIFAVYAGYVSQYYFSEEWCAFDLLMYVDPRRRGGYTITRLVKNFEVWTKSKGAKEIRPATDTGISAERTRDFYVALGYESVGFHLLKKV